MQKPHFHFIRVGHYTSIKIFRTAGDGSQPCGNTAPGTTFCGGNGQFLLFQKLTDYNLQWCIFFTENIFTKDAGYDPMIYITDYAGYVKYDLSEVMDYPLWYARYDVDAPSFYYDFAMWQYSSKGSVDGIKGNVDMDIWFIK